MSVIKDRTGQVFGRLTAVRCIGCNQRGAVWLCRCACDGKEIEVVSSDLQSGHALSCGCWRRENLAIRHQDPNFKPNVKHGYVVGGKSRVYQSWSNMMSRCTNPNYTQWNDYGGAKPPVLVCERWHGEHGFENFLADMGERPEGTSLSRYLDSGNYEPGNVEWGTAKQQAAERRGKHAMFALHLYRQLEFLAA
jgi:hypothetical protein